MRIIITIFLLLFISVPVFANPSFRTGYADASTSKYPDLWKNLEGVWISLGHTGSTVYDVVRQHNGVVTSATWGAGYMNFGSTSANEYVSVSSTKIINAADDKVFSIVVRCRPNYAVNGVSAVVAWGGTDDFLLYPNDSNAGNGPRVFWRDNGGNLININTGSDIQNEWHDFVFTARNGDQNLYMDGILVGSATETFASNGFSEFGIGKWMEGGHKFGGDIAGVYLYSRVLSQREAMAFHIDHLVPFHMVQRAFKAPVVAPSTRRIISEYINNFVNFIVGICK